MPASVLVMETLETEGLTGNTVVVFTSDNGPAMGGLDDDCADRYNGPFSGQKYDVVAEWREGRAQNGRL
jgi:arylsulfatase A-like enzyme